MPTGLIVVTPAAGGGGILSLAGHRATLNPRAGTLRSAGAHIGGTALVSFGESANFPLLVAIVVAAYGLAALAHLLAVSVSRRRRETACSSPSASSAAN